MGTGMGHKSPTNRVAPLLQRFYLQASGCETLVRRGLRFAALGFPLSVLSLAVHAASLTDVNALISQAVTTHPLVGAARAEEQATAEGITAAKLNLYPMPSVTSSYDKNDGMITRAGIRQPLWTGGKLSANVNQAIYDDKAATAYIFEQQNTVAKNTIDIWQSYIYATALQSLYVNNIKQLNEFESMMQRRVAQGVSARIDLDLVTNRILQDQNAYQGAVQQQRIAEARLSQMIGQPIRTNGAQAIPLDQMARYVKAQSRDFEQLAFNSGGINNPSVIKQQYQIEAAKQQVKAQQALQYPTIYAQYEHLYYHKDNENDGQFSLGLSYDPGAGFSNMALARASQARVQSLEQSQEAARRTVMEDIQTQYQQFASAKDQETSLVAAVAGAQIVVDSYRRQFIAGRKSWLEVLNAVREKAGYQQQLLQVQSQMLGAFYKLQVDFGRMPWQNLTPLTTPVKEYHPYLEFRDWLKQEMPTWTGEPNTSVDTFGAADSQTTSMLALPNLPLPKSADTSANADTEANTHVKALTAEPSDNPSPTTQEVTSDTVISFDVPAYQHQWLNGTIVYPSVDKVIAKSDLQAYQQPDTDETLLTALVSHYANHLPKFDGFSRYPEPAKSSQTGLLATQVTADVTNNSVETDLNGLPKASRFDTIGFEAQKVTAKSYEGYQASGQSPNTSRADGFRRYPEPSATKILAQQDTPTITLIETRSTTLSGNA